MTKGEGQVLVEFGYEFEGNKNVSSDPWLENYLLEDAFKLSLSLSLSIKFQELLNIYTSSVVASARHCLRLFFPLRRILARNGYNSTIDRRIYNCATIRIRKLGPSSPKIYIFAYSLQTLSITARKEKSIDRLSLLRHQIRRIAAFVSSIGRVLESQTAESVP